MKTKAPVPNRRLSGVDSAFLYLEREEMPLHMAAVCVFDAPIPFEKLVANIESKLHLIPRYRQVVVTPPRNADYPSWEDDPHFDIRRHILRVHLDAPGGEAELEALSGRILTPVMDRGKPLWDIYVVDGLNGGRGALIMRIHHALVDGIAGLALMNVILDSKPEIPPIRQPRVARKPRPVPEPSLAGALVRGILNSLENFVAAEAGILELLSGAAPAQNGLEGLLTEVVGAVERLPFNKPCGGGRKFCWAEFDLSEVLAIRAAAGGTVNDVFLAVLTRAIARYVELHGETVVNRLIRIVCPVNLRRNNDESTGNQISFLPVALPMDVEDPVRMLQAVASRTAIMKNSRAADLVTLAATCLGVAPPPLQEMLWRGITDVMLPLPLLNIICTNVPGSTKPLYCMGRRMIAAYPQVPTGYELGINCAVHTYCGKVFFGLIADDHVAPDVTRLRDFLRVSYEKLRLAAGVKKAAHPRPARPRATRKSPRRPVAKKDPGRARPAASEPVAAAPPMTAEAGV